MNVRRGLALFALVLAPCGCKALSVSPAIDHARDDVLGATRTAVEQALVGTLEPTTLAAVSGADSIYAVEAHQPAGLAARVAVLEALAMSSRDARLDALDDARDGSDDPLFRTHVDHLLEQDDAWFARSLEHDAIWTVTAGFFNGLLASGYALLNGNPIGVVKPLVHGVDGLIRDVPLDARDRKLAALKKRMAEKGDSSEEIADEIEALEEATVREELWLAEQALARDRADVAAMHWWVAKTVRPGDDDVRAMAGQIEERVKARGARLDVALRVEPVESRAGLEQRDRWAQLATAVVALGPATGALYPMGSGFKDIIGWYFTTLAGIASPDDPGVASIQGAMFPSGEIPEHFDSRKILEHLDFPTIVRAQLPAVRPVFRPILMIGAGRDANRHRSDEAQIDAHELVRLSALAESELVDPTFASTTALAEHDDERSRFVWTGRRDSHDPLKRYAEARATLHRSFLEHIEPIFWVPATLFRGAINLFTDPVNDQPVIDALARAARNLPDDGRRTPILRKLAQRLSDRGSAEQAFAVAKAAGISEADLVEYEEDAKTAATKRADARAQREAALAASGATIPAYALAPYATRYGFSRDIVDGKRDNGEVAPRGVHLDGSKLTLDVERDGTIESFEVTLNEVETRRMDALAREWGWRKRAAMVETYEKLHGGWPVEMYAGIGASGVAAYPRLLPEDVSGAERKLWE